MSSPQNEYAYAKQFAGNLRAESGPVPAKVHTRLRVLTGTSAREFDEYSRGAYDTAPQYVFGSNKELPLHPSLQAMGRHYFTW